MLSIAPLPLLTPVIKKVAFPLYFLNKSRTVLVYMYGPSSYVIATVPGFAQL